jgi:hypothetical protein
MGEEQLLNVLMLPRTEAGLAAAAAAAAAAAPLDE